MLNRRTLRIKIMQTLFAFDQCKEANHTLALDLIDERFTPNLNSMEVQDKEHLKKQKKAATQYFEKIFKGQTPATEDDEVVIKVAEEALRTYQQQVKKDQDFLAKNMLLEIEKLTNLYHSVLSLVLEFAELAAAEKKVNHSNFVNHPWITAISSNAELKKQLLRTDSGWQKNKDKVRGWFRDIIKDDQTYLEFIADKRKDEERQKELIRHVVRKLILGAGPINDFFEENDIRWAEDKVIVRSLVDKTIKSFADGKIEIQKLSLDWEDDRNFIERLFKNTVELNEKYKQLIAKNTKNWEVDRLALTDRVIIEMAMSEMIHFPNIPVKVTINEYIELTKDYSTPKSRQFINGILDVISKSMKETGDIKKSGRGLIDNK
jgi:N utilization substance protein B